MVRDQKTLLEYVDESWSLRVPCRIYLLLSCRVCSNQLADYVGGRLDAIAGEDPSRARNDSGACRADDALLPEVDSGRTTGPTARYRLLPGCTLRRTGRRFRGSATCSTSSPSIWRFRPGRRSWTRLTTSSSLTGRSATDKLFVLEWNEVTLYPAGTPSKDLTYDATLILPEGWKFGTSLPIERQTGNRVVLQADLARVARRRACECSGVFQGGRHYAAGRADPPRT